MLNPGTEGDTGPPARRTEVGGTGKAREDQPSPGPAGRGAEGSPGRSAEIWGDLSQDLLCPIAGRPRAVSLAPQIIPQL